MGMRYSTVLVDKICEAFLEGLSAKEIFGSPGFPVRSTWNYWLAEDDYTKKQFAETTKRIEEAGWLDEFTERYWGKGTRRTRNSLTPELFDRICTVVDERVCQTQDNDTPWLFSIRGIFEANEDFPHEMTVWRWRKRHRWCSLWFWYALKGMYRVYKEKGILPQPVCRYEGWSDSPECLMAWEKQKREFREVFLRQELRNLVSDEGDLAKTP